MPLSAPRENHRFAGMQRAGFEGQRRIVPDLFRPIGAEHSTSVRIRPGYDRGEVDGPLHTLRETETERPLRLGRVQVR